MEWIKMERKLPENYSTIFYTVEEDGERFVMIGMVYYRRNQETNQITVTVSYQEDEYQPEEEETRQILAWMPYPEPYQGT